MVVRQSYFDVYGVSTSAHTLTADDTKPSLVIFTLCTYSLEKDLYSFINLFLHGQSSSVLVEILPSKRADSDLFFGCAALLRHFVDFHLYPSLSLSGERSYI